MSKAMTEKNMTKQETMIYLMEQYHSEDPNVQHDAVEKMFEMHSPFITFLIKKHFSTFAQTKDDFEVLFQIGVVGFMQGLKTYNPTKGQPTTWFTHFIKHEISDYIDTFIKGTTAHYSSNISKINRAICEFDQKGVEYTNLDIANATGIKLESVIRARRIADSSNLMYYAEDENFEEHYTERACSPEEIIEKKEETEMLADCLKELPRTQREVVFLRTYNSLSFREIATRFDMTLEAVKKIYNEGLQSLRKSPTLRRAHRDYFRDNERVLNDYLLPVVPLGYATKAMEEFADDELTFY